MENRNEETKLMKKILCRKRSELGFMENRRGSPVLEI
jgi:hypothetical protein